MGMDIALQETPRRGKDGIKLHRGLLHSGGRDIRQRKIHGLSCRNKTRDFLIRALAWPTQPQHGIAAFSQGER